MMCQHDHAACAPVLKTRHETVWACPKCGKEFDSPLQCREHIEQEHGPKKTVRSVSLQPCVGLGPFDSDTGFGVSKPWQVPASEAAEAPKVGDAIFERPFETWCEADEHGSFDAPVRAAKEALLDRAENFARSMLAECVKLRRELKLTKEKK